MEQAAAICYRKTNHSVEFLLVRTLSGRWTFPKGSIERGEEYRDAALREAFEEAGVTGTIAREPLTTYLHIKKPQEDESNDVIVHAFLLEVKETQKSEEAHRNPTWFSFSAAHDALAEGRPIKYAEEARRVLSKALGSLAV
jgi:8-oxo-dGTP pyrophosphatase MutT (NUDIX family)